MNGWYAMDRGDADWEFERRVGEGGGQCGDMKPDSGACWMRWETVLYSY